MVNSDDGNLYTVNLSDLLYALVNLSQVQGMTAAADVETISGRTVHRGPQVRPGGGEETQQVDFRDLSTYDRIVSYRAAINFP